MQKVFALSTNRYALKMIELSLKNEGVEVFVSWELDCFHFIEDFAPDVLVIDVETLGDERESFLSECPYKGPIAFFNAESEGLPKPLPASGLKDLIIQEISKG
jgi:hypothetical protein